MARVRQAKVRQARPIRHWRARGARGKLSGKAGSKRKSDAEEGFTAFKAMANPTEMAILQDSQSSVGLIKETIKQERPRARPRARPLCAHVSPAPAQIVKLLIHRFVDSYRANGIRGSSRHLQGHFRRLQQDRRQRAG